MSNLDLTDYLLDIMRLIYALPFAVVGLVWLVMVAGPEMTRERWLTLPLLLLLSLVFKRQDYSLRLEIKPGVFSMVNGSFESLIYWSAVLMFGPTALWLIVVSATITFIRPLRLAWRLPLYQWRELTSSLAEGILPGLIAFLIYDQMGGVIPFAGVGAVTLGPVVLATLVWFLLPRLFALPFLWFVNRMHKGGLVSRRKLILFGLAGHSLAGIADPFAVLAAGLYAQQGIGVYLFLVAGVLLAGLLANRMSQATAFSQQRSRELAALERLGRSLLNTPLSASNLPDILSEQVSGMFPHSRMIIQLFPDEILFQQFPGGESAPESIWERLDNKREAHFFLSDVTLPGDKQAKPGWDGLAVAIVGIDDDKRLGGIYFLLNRDVRTSNCIADFLPALQSLAGQIALALYRAEIYQSALTAQAEVYQAEIYAQTYQAEVYAQALNYQKATQELVLAGQIQATFLPKDLPDIPGWQMAVALEPAREASGDFYDFIPLPDGRLGLLVADVADKGMGAALYMALSRTLIRTYALERHAEPAQVLADANRRILVDTSSDLFVTVFYAVLDLQTGQITYCNAGHNPSFIVQSQNGNQIHSMTRTALPLGLFDDMPWEQGVAQIMPGDVLVMYTDGVTETQNKAEDFFGVEQLEAITRANINRSADMIESKVITAVYDFAGDAPQFDDITLMVIVREE
ncbi:MAG: SpoIIE family protein phosphatase [Chloroflexi bacterium]|nr:SpoIIE family protein phosphatase [Chloroflexota bacterium]